VALVRQCGEAGLQEVVQPGGAQCPREQPPEPRCDDLRGPPPGRAPGADATATRHQLADRLTHAPVLDGLLAALMGVPFHERLRERGGPPRARETTARSRRRL